MTLFLAVAYWDIRYSICCIEKTETSRVLEIAAQKYFIGLDTNKQLQCYTISLIHLRIWLELVSSANTTHKSETDCWRNFTVWEQSFQKQLCRCTKGKKILFSRVKGLHKVSMTRNPSFNKEKRNNMHTDSQVYPQGKFITEPSIMLHPNSLCNIVFQMETFCLTIGVSLAKVCRSLMLLLTSLRTFFTWELRFWLAAYAHSTPILIKQLKQEHKHVISLLSDMSEWPCCPCVSQE